MELAQLITALKCLYFALILGKHLSWVFPFRRGRRPVTAPGFHSCAPGAGRQLASQEGSLSVQLLPRDSLSFTKAQLGVGSLLCITVLLGAPWAFPGGFLVVLSALQLSGTTSAVEPSCLASRTDGRTDRQTGLPQSPALPCP